MFEKKIKLSECNHFLLTTLTEKYKILGRLYDYKTKIQKLH